MSADPAANRRGDPQDAPVANRRRPSSETPPEGPPDPASSVRLPRRCPPHTPPLRMAWFHLTLSVDGRLPLGIDAPTRRRARHQLLRLHGDRIGSLALCDDHGHLLVEDQAQHVGFLAGGVRRSLQAIAQRPVHAHVRPVDERSHLLRLLAYHAEQPARHGFPGHPVLWPDGSAGDLVGARRTPGFRPELVRRWLPRWKPADLLAALRIPAPRRSATSPSSSSPPSSSSATTRSTPTPPRAPPTAPSPEGWPRPSPNGPAHPPPTSPAPCPSAASESAPTSATPRTTTSSPWCCADSR